MHNLVIPAISRETCPVASILFPPADHPRTQAAIATAALELSFAQEGEIPDGHVRPLWAVRGLYAIASNGWEVVLDEEGIRHFLGFVPQEQMYVGNGEVLFPDAPALQGRTDVKQLEHDRECDPGGGDPVLP